MSGSFPNIFHILFTGRFLYHQVQIHWDAQKRVLPADLTTQIDNFWNEHILQTPKSQFVFNGALCRLNKWQTAPNSLHLYLGRTDYKELLFTNHLFRQGKSHLEFEYRSNALGVSAVVTSSDNQLILIKRSQRVGENPGVYDVLGGHIHPEEHTRNGIPDPFSAIEEELHEELNVSFEREAIVCIGLLETTTTKKPELIFQAQSDRAAKDILKTGLSNPAPEIGDILALPNERGAIHTFLEKERNQISPSAFGALRMHIQTGSS